MDNKQFNGYIDERDDDVVFDEETGEKVVDTANKPTYYPTCRFCKKQQLPTAQYENQAIADEAATITCDCFDARQYQAEQERKQCREDNIIKLRQRLDDLSGYCDAHNVTLHPDAHDLLLRCGVSVLDGVVAKAVVSWARLKVNISLNNKDVIVIGYSYTDGGKMEV